MVNWITCSCVFTFNFSFIKWTWIYSLKLNTKLNVLLVFLHVRVTGVFRTLSNIEDGVFFKNSQALKVINYFLKTLHRRCLVGLWVCLWELWHNYWHSFQKHLCRSEYNFFKARTECLDKMMLRRTRWISGRTLDKTFFFFLKKSGHQDFVWFLKQFGATAPW